MKRIVVFLFLLLPLVFPAELYAVRLGGASVVNRGIHTSIFGERFFDEVEKGNQTAEMSSSRFLLEVGYGGPTWDVFGLMGGADQGKDFNSSFRPVGGVGTRLELVDFGRLSWGCGFSGLFWRPENDDGENFDQREYSFHTGFDYDAGSGVHPYGGLVYFQQRALDGGNTIFRQKKSQGVFAGVNIAIPFADTTPARDSFYTLNFEARYLEDIRFDFGVGINFGYDPEVMKDYNPDLKTDTYPARELPSKEMLTAAEEVKIALLQWQTEPDLKFEAEMLAEELQSLGMKKISVYERRDSLERAILQNRLSRQQIKKFLKLLDQNLLITGFFSYDGIHYDASAVLHDPRGRQLVRATGRTKKSTLVVLARKIVESIGFGTSAPYIERPPLRFR